MKPDGMMIDRLDLCKGRKGRIIFINYVISIYYLVNIL